MFFLVACGYHNCAAYWMGLVLHILPGGVSETTCICPLTHSVIHLTDHSRLSTLPTAFAAEAILVMYSVKLGIKRL
ncbi:hypothetical protein F4810DRAFT_679545, partial [Camillea tinctor]